MGKPHKGKYQPGPKYCGDENCVIYRSSWELATMVWLDRNPSVIKWHSEETVIPYLSPLDQKLHRYFIDFTVWFTDGTVYLIEVKPKKYLYPPKRGKRRTKKYNAQAKTYITNTCKWRAAKEFAADRKYIFEIWTEDVLKSRGIKILKE